MLGRKIPGFGPTPCDLMLIAEAGGVAEEKAGKPLVGKSGRETARYMRQARLVHLRDEYDYLGNHIYLTNVVKYRPFTRSLTGNNPPTPEDIRRDEPELIEEIRAVRPKFIAAIGAVSAKWLLGARYDSIEAQHGLPFPIVICLNCGARYDGTKQQSTHTHRRTSADVFTETDQENQNVLVVDGSLSHVGVRGSVLQREDRSSTPNYVSIGGRTDTTRVANRSSLRKQEMRKPPTLGTGHDSRERSSVGRTSNEMQEGSARGAVPHRVQKKPKAVVVQRDPNRMQDLQKRRQASVLEKTQKAPQRRAQGYACCRAYRPHRTTVVVVTHPAAGLHSPGSQPQIYFDFMALGQYIRGELPLTVPVDPYTDPDYYEVKGSSVSLLRNRPVYIDTEGLLGSVWGLSFTQHAGSAGVIRVENKRAVRSIKEQLRGMTVVMHHAIHDVPILAEMFGMTVAAFLAHIGGFEDTIVKAYVLRMPPLALKPACRRYLGMSMETYLDVVRDADRKIATEYLWRLLRTFKCTKCGGAGEYVDSKRVSAKTGKLLAPHIATCDACEGGGTSLPDPDVTVEYVDGEPKLRRGHRIDKRVRGILRDLKVKPAETDPRSRWDGVDYEYRVKVEDVAGVMRPVSLNDVEPQERAIQYSARDADSTKRYDGVLEEMIEADPKSDRLRRVYQINRDSMPMLMRMREVGTLIDIPFFGRLTTELTGKQNEILSKLSKLAGRHINPSSPKQVAELLFDDLNLPAVSLTKGGDESTADKVLEDLKLQVAAWEPSRKKDRTLTVLTYITDYREFGKMKGTYTEKLPRAADKNGRIHTTFRATTTEGNRTSSADPNLFNIPNPDRSELGKQVRCGFIAPEGYVLLEADMSQIEMRVLAHESQDERLCEAIRNGADIHTNTAMMIFNVAKDHVEKWMRTASKTIGFGIVYGISAPALKAQIKLRTGLDVTVEDAQGYIDAYLEVAYPGIGGFMLDCYAEARRYGYSEDMFGWRRYLPGVHSAIASVKAESERIAVNNKIQAGASGIVKLSAPVIMDEVLPYLRKKGWDCDPLLTVYDSYLFQVKIGGEELLGKMVKEAMISQIKLRVPLDVDVHWGRSWGGIKGAA